MVLEYFEPHFIELTSGKWAELKMIVQRYEEALGAEIVNQIQSEEEAARRTANSRFRHSFLGGSASSLASQIPLNDKPSVSEIIGSNGNGTALSSSNTSQNHDEVNLVVLEGGNLGTSKSSASTKLIETDIFAAARENGDANGTSKEERVTSTTSSTMETSKKSSKSNGSSGGTEGPIQVITIDDDSFGGHRRVAHPNSSYYLCQCGIGGTSRKTLENHLRIRFFGNAFKCPAQHCCKSYGYGCGGFDAFRLHCQKSHRMKFTGLEAGCLMCGSQFGTRKELLEHESKSCPGGKRLEAAMEIGRPPMTIVPGKKRSEEAEAGSTTHLSEAVVVEEKQEGGDQLMVGPSSSKKIKEWHESSGETFDMWKARQPFQHSWWMDDSSLLKNQKRRGRKWRNLPDADSGITSQEIIQPVAVAREDILFHGRIDLKYHGRVPSKDPYFPYSCKCGYTKGRTSTDLEQHLKHWFSLNAFKCGHCKATYGNSNGGFEAFKSHCRSAHNKPIVEEAGCDMCGLTFETRMLMVVHQSKGCSLAAAVNAAMQLEGEKEEGVQQSSAEIRMPNKKKNKTW